MCNPGDIELAIHYGVDGVVISNHGGRQLDGTPATLDALRMCAQAARRRIPLAIDGGIRRGSDIFKALALGASYCFVGRIPVWGLAVSDSFCQRTELRVSTTDNKVLSWRSAFCVRSSGSPWH